MSDEAYLVGRLEEAFAREGETDVHARVDAGHLVVTGNVLTEERRDAVAAIAHELAGDLAVDDHVTVLHCREPDGEERLA